MEKAFIRFWAGHAAEIPEDEWKERCKAFGTAQEYKDYVWIVFSEGWQSCKDAETPSASPSSAL